MIGIIVALPHEAEYLLNELQQKRKITVTDKPAYIGLLNNTDVVVVICGIGKVNSALATQAVIDKFSPSTIINFGSAGGFDGKTQVLDYYCVDKCCQYDFDLSELDPVPVGYIQDYDTVLFKTDSDKIDFLPKANLASADRFTDKSEFLDIIQSIGCTLRDMEGGAIAQVCTANKTPLVLIKGVSDNYGSSTSADQFRTNLTAVFKGFPEIIKKVINALL